MIETLRNRVGWLAPLGLVLGLAWLLWMALGDNRVQFLPSGPAPWIVYPSPFNGETIRAFELPADFHQSFVLHEKPARAVLDWRCFRRCRIILNGRAVNSDQSANWKHFASVDVAPLLREGENNLEIIAWAAMGPPAISAKLRMGDTIIVTGDDWDVSYAGSLRLPARVVATEPDYLPGPDSVGAGRLPGAFKAVWPYECLFFAASFASALALRRFFNQTVILTLLASSWIILLAHNISYVRFVTGFDASAHVDYIDFIQKNGKLPHADQGWEMFQPPLYYLISAEALRVFGAAAFSEKAMVALRLFNLLVGAANIALVHWGLRMIFPGDQSKQLIGTALAAFVPCQLYLLHYPTNEILAAALGTASLCLCLRCLQSEPISIWWRLGLGVVLGAAFLTKVSVVALVPAIFGALAGRLLARGERKAGVWVRELGLALVLTVLVGGWPYLRQVAQYGNPVAGIWSTGGRLPWWQQPGCVTAHYFAAFGHVLLAPYSVGFRSFWDTLYATFWGDAFCGGQLGNGRAPWNYDFMTVGYLLALPLALLIVVGFGISVLRWIRQPRAGGFLLLSAAGAYLFALAFFMLKLPDYDSVRAFYGLSALLPLCVFAAEGWSACAARSRTISVVLLGLIGGWWLNLGATYWIKPDSAQFRLCRAMSGYQLGMSDSLAEFQSVLAVDPHNAVAQLYTALLYRESGRTDQFAAVLKQARADHPDDGQLCALEADFYARQKNWSIALPLAERATRLAPDDYTVALTWMRFARANDRDADVVAAGELVLRCRPGLKESHQAMASALVRLGEPDEAALHADILAGIMK
jgi:tetratricopeptide (TPR) repeat protein